MKKRDKGKSNSLYIQQSCCIKFIRNKDYFVFTNDNQKNGSCYVQQFPWKKKDILEEAYKCLIEYDGRNLSIDQIKKAYTITSLEKYSQM